MRLYYFLLLKAMYQLPELEQHLLMRLFALHEGTCAHQKGVDTMIESESTTVVYQLNSFS